MHLPKSLLTVIDVTMTTNDLKLRWPRDELVASTSETLESIFNFFHPYHKSKYMNSVDAKVHVRINNKYFLNKKYLSINNLSFL